MTMQVQTNPLLPMQSAPLNVANPAPKKPSTSRGSDPTEFQGAMIEAGAQVAATQKGIVTSPAGTAAQKAEFPGTQTDLKGPAAAGAGSPDVTKQKAAPLPPIFGPGQAATAASTAKQNAAAAVASAKTQLAPTTQQGNDKFVAMVPGEGNPHGLAHSSTPAIKPWDKDWVFHGDESFNPNQKSLFPGSEAGATAKASANPGEKAAPGKSLVEPGVALAARQAQLLPGDSLAARKTDPSMIDRQAPGQVPGNANNELQRMMNELNGTVESFTSSAEPAIASPKKEKGLKSVAGGPFANESASAVPTDWAGGMPSIAVGAKPQGSRDFSQNGGGDSDAQKPTSSIRSTAKAKPLQMTGEEFLSSGRTAVLGPQPQAAGASKAAPQLVAGAVTGHVVQGAMNRDRLSNESLRSIGSEIKNVSTGNGMGEIRIRLKPDNLGELHLKVRTSGNQVGIEIQASDEKAKQVIEESMSHLKESLASQNLNLGKIEIAVHVASTDAGNNTSSQQFQNQNQQNPQQSSFDMNRNGWDSNGQGNRGGSETGSSGDPVGMPRYISGVSSSRSAAAAASGRLDVMA